MEKLQVSSGISIFALWGSLVIFLSGHLIPPAHVAAGMSVLLLAAWRRPDSRIPLVMLAMLYPAYVVVDVEMLTGMGAVAHRVHLCDDLLSHLDGGFSVAAFHWFQAHPIFSRPLVTVYCWIGFFIAFSLAVGDWRRLLRAYLAMSLIAPLIYAAIPAVGPAYGGVPGAPPNCLPSCHMATALIGTIYLPERWRWTGAVYAILTACATISTGQHYVIDLIAAIPFSIFCAAITQRISMRSPSLPMEPLPSE